MDTIKQDEAIKTLKSKRFGVTLGGGAWSFIAESLSLLRGPEYENIVDMVDKSIERYFELNPQVVSSGEGTNVYVTQDHTIQMTLDECDTVVNVLSMSPYFIVAPIINKIFDRVNEMVLEYKDNLEVLKDGNEPQGSTLN